MKSITDATWKDAAAIEVRSLIARLESTAAYAQEHADLPIALTLNALTRQATRLADLIDKIDERAPESRDNRNMARQAVARHQRSKWETRGLAAQKSRWSRVAQHAGHRAISCIKQAVNRSYTEAYTQSFEDMAYDHARVACRAAIKRMNLEDDPSKRYEDAR